MKKSFWICICYLGIVCLFGCGMRSSDIAAGCRQIDEFTIKGGRDFLTGYPAKNADGSVNVVVEIPAGTNAKWEVNATLQDGSKPADGKLRWEFKEGQPRIVRYLSYPGNYGFIPNTLSGDGDPLDIIVLGPAVPRGSIIQVKLIGILKMLDGKEKDDKLIGVSANSPLYSVKELIELDEEFPGVTKIIETWFMNYKRKGEMEMLGWGDREESKRIFIEAEILGK